MHEYDFYMLALICQSVLHCMNKSNQCETSGLIRRSNPKLWDNLTKLCQLMSTVCLFKKIDFTFDSTIHTCVEMLQKKQQQRTTGTSFIKTCNKNLTLNHDKHKRTSFNITQMTNNLKSTIHGMNNWPIKNPVKIQTKFTKRK